MKRSYLGLGLLGLLLILGILTSRRMDNIHLPLSHGLERAAQLALEEDWESADTMVETVRAAWEKSAPFIAALTDHSPMESLKAHFAQLAVCRQLRDRAGFAALCAEMACQLEAISEAQQLTLKNLF